MRLSAVITFLPQKSDLFTDQTEFLKTVACHSAPSWEVFLKGKGQCVGSLLGFLSRKMQVKQVTVQSNMWLHQLWSDKCL